MDQKPPESEPFFPIRDKQPEQSVVSNEIPPKEQIKNIITETAPPKVEPILTGIKTSSVTNEDASKMANQPTPTVILNEKPLEVNQIKNVLTTEMPAKEQPRVPDNTISKEEPKL